MLAQSETFDSYEGQCTSEYSTFRDIPTKESISGQEMVKLQSLSDLEQNSDIFRGVGLAVPYISLKRVRENVDLVTDEAELELLTDKALQIGVDKIIDRIKSELKAENIDCSVILEVFNDVEVENWNSFGITIKPKDPIASHKTLMTLWDKLLLSIAEETNKLESRGEIIESERDHIQSKLVISVEVD